MPTHCCRTVNKSWLHSTAFLSAIKRKMMYQQQSCAALAAPLTYRAGQERGKEWDLQSNRELFSLNFTDSTILSGLYWKLRTFSQLYVTFNRHYDYILIELVCGYIKLQNILNTGTFLGAFQWPDFLSSGQGTVIRLQIPPWSCKPTHFAQYEQSHGNQGSYIWFLIQMHVGLWEIRTLFDIRDKPHSLNFT